MAYRATIEPIGETIEVEAGQTLLDAALRAGVWLPYACNHGVCGTCKVTVLEGEVEHNEASSFALMDLERDEGKALACCATLASDIALEADVEEEADALNLPVGDFTGTVARLEDLTPTVKGIWLEAPEEVAFQAGQYLNLEVPGVAAPRAFSIANPPAEGGWLELNVRRVEGGAATTYLSQSLKIGERLRFTAPLGRFFARKSTPGPVIFLAGGSGLSSPKSMILDLLQAGDQREITLLHGARNQAELYYRELFTELAAQHDNFHYHGALSEAAPEDDWDGPRCFVHELAEELFNGRFEGCVAYLCGPPPMIDSCLTTLMRGRLFEERIFMENFFTAADSARPPRRSALFKKF